MDAFSASSLPVISLPRGACVKSMQCLRPFRQDNLSFAGFEISGLKFASGKDVRRRFPGSTKCLLAHVAYVSKSATISFLEV